MNDSITCVICPPKADGTRVTHRWAIKGHRRHYTLSAMVRAGELERSWWGLSLADRRLLVTTVERDGGTDLTHLRELVEQDGRVRNFAFRYAMTSGKSQLDGMVPPKLADELALWAARHRS